MESILSGSSRIAFGENGRLLFRDFLAGQRFSSIFVLTDSNTRVHCLPVFGAQFPEAGKWTILEIPAGEAHKNITTCLTLWQQLSGKGADRQSLLVNLGGGVVTDLGGFVASTYQRGIAFVNIPTTLLSMVDASVGGKTGVDLGLLKNQIGVIQDPELVLIDSGYLNTLEERQLRSGFAEMLKHGLILEKPYWDALKNTTNFRSLQEHIHTSVILKNNVVLEDPRESGLRKILNFGHTLGHAIESFYLGKGEGLSLLHGEAIAAGMVMESYLSVQHAGLSTSECDEIKSVMLRFFPRVPFPEADREAILELLRFDKKNSAGSVRFALLQRIGKACTHQEVTRESLRGAFEYYAD
ncbi:3-dehydroquinate synthase [Robiginitalea marina]|uniref:3-dehydroquinate synthase n=1 Tax=Robiginitalea marina TaxID=2954105 RepID=A0ABT1AUD2_9FLAO|nr:3-dehydroquinate synthase [Robiginitalea marina]MCO5723591.1 3-dehydroquinate synthase [Robiginitalea marina]